MPVVEIVGDLLIQTATVQSVVLVSLFLQDMTGTDVILRARELWPNILF
ncbi:MAG TPA: hypothetical protein VL361_17580 [Candidatus Limnocylindrales bacterium]|nr:hypothetical protein [Candidatus Limnocylindrales bacterium]